MIVTAEILQDISDRGGETEAGGLQQGVNLEQVGLTHIVGHSQILHDLQVQLRVKVGLDQSTAILTLCVLCGPELPVATSSDPSQCSQFPYK